MELFLFIYNFHDKTQKTSLNCEGSRLLTFGLIQKHFLVIKADLFYGWHPSSFTLSHHVIIVYLHVCSLVSFVSQERHPDTPVGVIAAGTNISCHFMTIYKLSPSLGTAYAYYWHHLIGLQNQLCFIVYDNFVVKYVYVKLSLSVNCEHFG